MLCSRLRVDPEPGVLRRIYPSPFVALTVLVVLGTEQAWYLISFSPAGKALDKARIAASSEGAFSEEGRYRYEHWSELTPAFEIVQTSLYRFYDAGGEEATCTRTRWQWRLMADGFVDRSGGEHQESCVP